MGSVVEFVVGQYRHRLSGWPMDDADARLSIQERPSKTGASSRIPQSHFLPSLDGDEIIRGIGRGGTANFHEAYHKSPRRKVALKQLPAAAKSIGSGSSFLLFAVCMIAQAVFVWKVLLETKGVSLEGVQKKLGVN